MHHRIRSLPEPTESSGAKRTMATKVEEPTLEEESKAGGEGESADQEDDSNSKGFPLGGVSQGGGRCVCCVLLLIGLLRVDNLLAGIPPHTELWSLAPEEELRIQASKKSGPVKVKLLKGAAEIFGCELAVGREYEFTAAQFAVFTWDGCEIQVEGKPDFAYTAGETPMLQYLNLHGALERMREAAWKSGDPGPTVSLDVDIHYYSSTSLESWVRSLRLLLRCR